MASTPEKIVKKRVTDILKEYGAWYFSPMTHGFGRSGIPDIIACYKGHFLGIECKAGKNVPTALQERELAAIEVQGGVTFVIYEHNVELLGGFLKLVAAAEQGL